MKKLVCSYNENAKVNYKICNLITPCLNGLELYLKDLRDKQPDSFTMIIDYLIGEYGSKEDFGISIDTEYEILNQYPELIKGSINAVLSLVKYNKYNQPSIDDEIEIDALDLIRTFNQFEYTFMTSLLKIMSRKEAIEYIKILADEVAHSRRNPENYVSDFEELLDRYKQNLERWLAQDIVAEIVNDGTLIYKVNKCVWAEVLKDFDLELSYAMMCYQDFENTKNQNPNFKLTRTKTIMQGNEYCDFCYHDTRKVKDITHPSDKDFQDLG